MPVNSQCHGVNDENILTSVKKILLIGEEYTEFDMDIRLHINTVLSNLVQMGIGPAGGFSVVTGEETWKDFVGNNKNVQQIKTLVALKVRTYFDPPQNATHMKALEDQIKELEVRLYTECGGY